MAIHRNTDAQGVSVGCGEQAPSSEGEALSICGISKKHKRAVVTLEYIAYNLEPYARQAG